MSLVSLFVSLLGPHSSRASTTNMKVEQPPGWILIFCRADILTYRIVLLRPVQNERIGSNDFRDKNIQSGYLGHEISGDGGKES